MKAIINGWYRTGSTLLFYMVDESNPKIKVFVEPLHPRAYYNQVGYDKSNPQPKERKNYLLLTTSKYKKLRKKHFLINFDYFIFNKKVKDYLDEIDGVNKSVLQTNRAHFYLEELANKYDCNYIHLIRNPLDQWYSFKEKNPSKKFRKLPFKKELKRILNLRKKPLKNMGDFFYLIKFYLKRIGKSSKKSGPFYLNEEFKKLFPEKKIVSEFEKFVLLWHKINHNVIKNLNKKNGKIIWYDDMINEPEKEMREISKFLNIKLKKDRDIYKKAQFKFRERDVKKFLKVVKKHGLEKQTRKIFSDCRNKKIKKYYGF